MKWPVAPQDGVRVFLGIEAVDMRKSIDSLSVLVAGQLKLDPYSGHLFAFSNRRRTVVKVLYWDRNGFCLWQKRLEREHFRWPETRDDLMDVTMRELHWLLDGLEIEQSKAHSSLRFGTAY